MKLTILDNLEFEEWRINRRTLLRSAGVASGAVLAGGSIAGVGSADHAESAMEVMVSQAGERLGCVTPFSYHDEAGDSVSVTEFYNYHSDEKPGGPNTPHDLEEDGHSRMFFFEDEDGITLVFLQDDYDPNKSQGEKERHTELEFSGLPSDDGEAWLEIEQTREGEDEYGTDTVHWQWFPRYSDGGAYGYLTCDFDITIDADFYIENDQSDATWLDEGGWTLLSGAVDDPDVITLDPDEPVRLTCGCCTDCDSDGSLAKYEFECTDYDEEDEECLAYDFHLEGEGDAGIRYGGDDFETKDGEAWEPMSVTFETDYCEVSVLVKSGQDFDVQTPSPSPDGTITVDSASDTHAISFVEFYCDEETAQEAAGDFPSNRSGNHNKSGR